jgi:hypothetical protein
MREAGFSAAAPDADACSVRGTASSDHAFWSNPGTTDGEWIGDLAPDDGAEAHALDDLASGDHTDSDRVFHELRDISTAPVTEGLAPVGSPEDPDDAPPPAATAAFDINAVSDDLLPSWNLDLG